MSFVLLGLEVAGPWTRLDWRKLYEASMLVSFFAAEGGGQEGGVPFVYAFNLSPACTATATDCLDSCHTAMFSSKLEVCALSGPLSYNVQQFSILRWPGCLPSTGL